MNIDADNQSVFQADLNLNDLLSIIIARKKVSLFFIGVFSLAGIIYSLSLSNIYQSTIKLIPQEELSLASQSFNGLSSLLGGGRAAKTKRLIYAEQLISSQSFVSDLILKHQLAETILMPKAWNPKTGALSYQTSDFFSKPNPTQDDIMNIYSPMERVNIFMGNLDYDFDDDSNLILMSYSHLSPTEASRILGLVVAEINSYIQKYEIDRSTVVYDNLKSKLLGENISDVRSFITELMQLQLKTIMMANDKEFVYRIIDGPITPEKKFRPLRAVICIIFFIIGSFIGFFASLAFHFFDINRIGTIKLI